MVSPLGGFSSGKSLWGEPSLTIETNLFWRQELSAFACQPTGLEG